MARAPAKQAAPQFDRLAATCAALVVVGLATFLLIRNEPIADARLFYALRVVVSFSVAVLGATIPGFLNVGWSGGGLAVRAGGALALFVLTFVYTPDLVTKPAQGDRAASTTPSQQIGRQTIAGAPGGVTAGTINGGTYNLGGGSAPPPASR